MTAGKTLDQLERCLSWAYDARLPRTFRGLRLMQPTKGISLLRRFGARVLPRTGSHKDAEPASPLVL